MKTKHILLVEDDAIIASGLIYALEQEGYAAKPVTIKKCHNENPIAVLRYVCVSMCAFYRSSLT